MAAVLRSAMRLTANHVDYFTYNILRGLRFLHSLGLAHGSVCPSNVWLNANDDIQLSHLCYMHPADVPIADEASAEANFTKAATWTPRRSSTERWRSWNPDLLAGRQVTCGRWAAFLWSYCSAGGSCRAPISRISGGASRSWMRSWRP
ncbi:MPK6 [Symbiodinium microadriaticum]|nr:MPK6 [Symbiodinium microadriaticum]